MVRGDSGEALEMEAPAGEDGTELGDLADRLTEYEDMRAAWIEAFSQLGA